MASLRGPHRLEAVSVAVAAVAVVHRKGIKRGLTGQAKIKLLVGLLSGKKGARLLLLLTAHLQQLQQQPAPSP